MKWVKWIIPIMAISLVVTCVCVNKHKKDWENDFAPYSIRMLLPETNYVEQPAYNMIGEEQFLIGQTENEYEKYYFTELTDKNNVARVYSYDKKSKETKLIYEIVNETEWGMLSFVSGNGEKLVLDYSNRIVLVDIDTQISKEIFSGTRESSAILGQILYYSDINGNLYSVNLKNNDRHKINGIKATVFVIHNNLIYF